MSINFSLLPVMLEVRAEHVECRKENRQLYPSMFGQYICGSLQSHPCLAVDIHRGYLNENGGERVLVERRRCNASQIIRKGIHLVDWSHRNEPTSELMCIQAIIFRILLGEDC